MTTIERIARKEAAGAAPEALYQAVFTDLLAAGTPDERVRLAARDPDDIDLPWSAAIAATVEHAAVLWDFETPAWLDNGRGLMHATAIVGRTHEEWSEALHGAHGAFVRHEVFPDPAAVTAAAGGRVPALRGTRGPTTAEWAIDTTRAVEALLEEGGLRGHIYLHLGTAAWFTTEMRPGRRNTGQARLAAAIRSAAGTTDAREWVAALAESLAHEKWGRASLWWDTPHLLVTGTVGPEAAAGALGGGGGSTKEIDTLLYSSEVGRSVGGADRATRAATGRPLGEAVRRRVAAITGETLARGSGGWVDRWLTLAAKHLPEGDAERLIHRSARRETGWTGGPEMTCGDLEANLREAEAPAADEGRLWIELGRGGREPRLVLVDGEDPGRETEITAGRDVASAFAEHERRRRALASTGNEEWNERTRPGWKTVAELAAYMAAESVPEAERFEVTGRRVRNGRLELTGRPAKGEGKPSRRVAGILDAARTLSGETCEVCSGKGDPVAADDGTPLGTRCIGCRPFATRTIERQWPAAVPQAKDGPYDREERIERRHGNDSQRLMRANADHGRARWRAASIAGWTGIVRALYLTLRDEQEERPGDPEHHPWRLGTMKEKWGGLRLESTAVNAYQSGVVDYLEMVSQWTCVRCGRDAELRIGRWVRPECNECWRAAAAEDVRKDAEAAEARKAALENAGFRGTVIGTWGFASAMRMSIAVPLPPTESKSGE